MDQAINIVIASLLVPFLMNIIRETLDAIKSTIKQWFDARSETNKITICGSKITSTKDSRTTGAMNMITMIAWYIDYKKTTMNGCDVTDSMLPTGTCYVDGFSITVKRGETSGKVMTETIKITVGGESIAKVKEFLDHIKTLYNEKCCETTRYFYKIHRVNNCSSGVYLVRFEIGPVMSGLASLIIPGIDNIVKMVDKYVAGEVPKLTILLHGPPGTGKTSFIKALAAYIDASIFELSLAVKRNSQLYVQMFSNPIYHEEGEKEQAVHIGFKRRVYIMEDIDAESAIVTKRSGATSEFANAMQDVANGGSTKKPKVTLAGLLNLLDGVVEMRSIVVITTNHIDKLDPALIRPGRVDININTKPLDHTNAAKIALKHGFVVPDGIGSLTIAQISNAIRCATSQSHFEEILGA